MPLSAMIAQSNSAKYKTTVNATEPPTTTDDATACFTTNLPARATVDDAVTR
ncbi:MAG TPA: hypothetical protein VHK90_02190 [Thermoanaerobaculia bacterium]|nr:hypothetical protein [Thermoanaerobaculia bacterium]